MRIEIEIPKEFEQHFSQDKFKDSFERIMTDIEYDSLKNENYLCAGKYEHKIIGMLEKAFENSKKAYPVNEAVSQLEDYGNEEISYYRGTPYENCIRECVSKAIEITKSYKPDNSQMPDQTEYFYVWKADAENDGVYRFFNSEDTARTAFLESKTENKTFGIASFAKGELTPISVILSTL